MNAVDLATLAANAGFTGSDVDTAVAIALAESNGNPSKYNPEPTAPGGTPAGQGSYGLWQIYLKKHPEFASWNLLDPQANAVAAYDIYQREGWNAWTTYKTRRYLAFLPTPAPLTLDAATGLPVDDGAAAATAAPLQASLTVPPSTAMGFGAVLLWVAFGIAALWIFEES